MNTYNLENIRRYGRQAARGLPRQLALQVRINGAWCTLNSLGLYEGEEAARKKLQQQGQDWFHNYAPYRGCAFQIVEVY